MISVHSRNGNATFFDEIFSSYFLDHNGYRHNPLDIVCTYLWHFKRKEYKWYVHDFEDIDDVNQTSYTSLAAGGASFAPKPLVCIDPGHHDHKSVNKIIVAGYCLSPPFPKHHIQEVQICNGINRGSENFPFQRVRCS